MAPSSKASKGGSHKCCLPLCARLLALCASSLACHVYQLSANSCLIRARLLALYLCSYAMSDIIVPLSAFFVLGCWLSIFASMPCLSSWCHFLPYSFSVAGSLCLLACHVCHHSATSCLIRSRLLALFVCYVVCYVCHHSVTSCFIHSRLVALFVCYVACHVCYISATSCLIRSRLLALYVC